MKKIKLTFFMIPFLWFINPLLLTSQIIAAPQIEPHRYFVCPDGSHHGPGLPSEGTAIWCEKNHHSVPDQIREKVKQYYHEQYPSITAFDITFGALDSVHLQQIFAGVSFYTVVLGIVLPRQIESIAVQGDKVVFLTREFNLLLKSDRGESDNEHDVNVAFAFAQLSDPEACSRLTLNRESVVSSSQPGYTNVVKFTTYSKLGGIVETWEFSFTRNQISKVIERVVEIGKGDYIIDPPVDYKKSHWSIGIPKLHIPATY